MAMEVKQVLRMAGGTGETSYATNSSFQKAGIFQLKHLIEEAVLGLYSDAFPDYLTIADLGCSSGPNTLWVISEIIDVVEARRHHIGCPSPQYLIYLNDLESNDFNTIFKSLLPPFYEKLRAERSEDFGPCFVAAMPGSFYGKLFPNKSLHIVHSSYSVHWLSQAPMGLEDDLGNPLNKGNIYAAESSPPGVFEAYSKQFQKDFSSFLRFRSEELVSEGRMVLILSARKSGKKEYKYNWDLLNKALQNMVLQGVIKESELDSFNVPFYSPSLEELRDVIASEGSFCVDRLEAYDFLVDPRKNNERDARVDHVDEAILSIIVKAARALVGPLLGSHFGEHVIDKVLENYREIAKECWREEHSKFLNVGISLTRTKYDAHF